MFPASPGDTFAPASPRRRDVALLLGAKGAPRSVARTVRGAVCGLAERTIRTTRRVRIGRCRSVRIGRLMASPQCAGHSHRKGLGAISGRLSLQSLEPLRQPQGGRTGRGAQVTSDGIRTAMNSNEQKNGLLNFSMLHVAPPHVQG